jgi:hypothetical protein
MKEEVSVPNHSVSTFEQSLNIQDRHGYNIRQARNVKHYSYSPGLKSEVSREGTLTFYIQWFPFLGTPIVEMMTAEFFFLTILNSFFPTKS